MDAKSCESFDMSGFVSPAQTTPPQTTMRFIDMRPFVAGPLPAPVALKPSGNGDFVLVQDRTVVAVPPNLGTMVLQLFIDSEAVTAVADYINSGRRTRPKERRKFVFGNALTCQRILRNILDRVFSDLLSDSEIVPPVLFSWFYLDWSFAWTGSLSARKVKALAKVYQNAGFRPPTDMSAYSPDIVLSPSDH